MENIKNLLQKIELEKNIKILFACETGSRAWGFPSPDSDFDVRFIYMHNRDWYLSLSERKDTIEFMDGEMDITGWDLRKSLMLLKKSNAPLIERFNSPIEYFNEGDFNVAFKELVEECYSPIAVYFHHYSLAKKFWDELKDADEIKLKSYFYLIRSLLSCNWAVRSKTVVPMDIESLMTLIEDETRNRIRKLIKLKATVGEKYLYQKDNYLNACIEKLWVEIEEQKDKLEIRNADFKLLDNFFLKMIHEYADYRNDKK